MIEYSVSFYPRTRRSSSIHDRQRDPRSIRPSMYVIGSGETYQIPIAFEQSTGTTFQTGQDIVVRAQFVRSGILPNTQDTNFRAVSDDWPVFALAHDLGTISATSEPVVFSIGHVRDPAIEYLIANDATQNRSLFFWSRAPSIANAVSPCSLLFDGHTCSPLIWIDIHVPAGLSKRARTCKRLRCAGQCRRVTDIV